MTASARVRVAFVEDHPVYCEGLRSVLQSDTRLEFVGEASDAREGLALARRAQPDVLLTDIALKGGATGITLTRTLTQQPPAPRILVLSVQTGESYVRSAYDAGARGYVNKADPPAALVAAVHAVANGGSFWPTGVDFGAGLNVLTKKELEVARLLARGFRNGQIATILQCSPRTVEAHRAKIYEKLGVGTVIGVREKLEERGLLETESVLIEIEDEPGNPERGPSRNGRDKGE
ncbi:MAG TPA: response regulator transcription factor [Polyangiaceae bacterium]|nr:response regulator transcription factor [Polyangiaceae bacterium]